MASLPNSSGHKLSHLLEGYASVEFGELVVSSLTLDSRAVTRDTLFLACSGGTRHGLEFLQQAVEQGAAAIAWEPDQNWTEARVAELGQAYDLPLIPVADLRREASEIAARFYGHPSKHMSVIGITGTNGKTSSTQFLARGLGRCGVIGTLGNGFPDALEPTLHTTPDPVDLQALLKGMRDAGGEAIAMEVSSHALDQGRVDAVHFDVAVLTNLSRDHLDYHGSMEEYAASKLKLFLYPGLRCAVINLDDPFGWQILDHLPAGVQALGYSLAPIEELPERLDGWLWARSVQPSSEGIEIEVQTSYGDGEFHSRLLGRFNVSNLLAVLGVLLQHDIPLDDALGRLAELKTVAGRMEKFGGGDQPLVVVDYAHTPDALEHALLATREHVAGNLICVFGCGGDRDRGKRPQMAEIAERLADRAIVTDDNPRTEDGDRIVSDILAGMQRPEKAQVIRDRREAIRAAVSDAVAGDLVLICGKGHEDYQLVGDQKLHFCDREEVRAVLGVAA
jgi:UDP-N-acetylmuramoyl-L-alanyl-D-glutamate--2,6-diaminopimelate ligase